MINFRIKDSEFFEVLIDGLPIRTYPRIYQAKITSTDRVIIYNIETETELYRSLRFDEFSINGIIGTSGNSSQVLLNVVVYNSPGADLQNQIDTLQNQINNIPQPVDVSGLLPYTGATQDVDINDKALFFSKSGWYFYPDFMFSPNGDKYFYPKGSASQISTIQDLNNAINGIGPKADLDVNGLIIASQLPSFVDDVLEFYALANFPTTGESSKIYVDKVTNKSYRWSGTTYIRLDDGVILGITSATAFRGDLGQLAYLHSQILSGNPHGTTKFDIGLSNVDNVADTNKPVSTPQANVFNLKQDKISVAINSIIPGNATTSQKIRISDQGINSDITVDNLFSIATAKDANGKIILPIPITLDGNNYNVVSLDAIANVAPTNAQVSTLGLVNGDTATKFLTDNKIEYWAYTNVWTLIKTTNPTTLDGNDTHINRANANTNIAPTLAEIPVPMNGDTAKVKLNNGVIEFWSFSTIWNFNFSTLKTNVVCRNKIAQNLPIGWSVLNGWTEIQDLGNNFDGTTFTCVNAGSYIFSTGDGVSITANVYYGMAIRKNGTQLYNDLRFSSVAGTYYASISGVVELAVGDTLVSTFYRGGGTGNDTPSASNSWFTINQL